MPDEKPPDASSDSAGGGGRTVATVRLVGEDAVRAAEIYYQRARAAEDRLAEVLGAYKDLKADDEGYRERITRNIERRYDQRRERLLLKFIEILDNLDRALEAAETTEVSPALVEGLILVRTQLLQTLQDEGLERIPVIGLPYNPEVSEAVETVAVDDPEQHHVVLRDLQRGYRLNGRVARASKVVVGQQGGNPPAKPEPEAAKRSPAPKPGEVEITFSKLTALSDDDTKTDAD